MENAVRNSNFNVYQIETQSKMPRSPDFNKQQNISKLISFCLSLVFFLFSYFLLLLLPNAPILHRNKHARRRHPARNLPFAAVQVGAIRAGGRLVPYRNRKLLIIDAIFSHFRRLGASSLGFCPRKGGDHLGRLVRTGSGWCENWTSKKKKKPF